MDYTEPTPTTSHTSRIRLLGEVKMRDRTAGQTLVKRIPLTITLSAWPARVICVFAVALVIRGIFVVSLQDGFYFFDSVDYSTAAMNLITHGEFGESYKRPPLYPLLLAGIYAVVGEQIVAVRLIEALLGACLAVAIALLGRHVGGDTVGALAGLLWSLYPMGIFIVCLVYPTNLATLLLACAVLGVVSRGGPALAPACLVGSGVLLGLTALTVSVALVTIPVMALWVAYWHRSRRLYLATLLCVGAALPLALWTVRNFYVYERIVIIEPRLVPTLEPRLAQLFSWIHKPDVRSTPQMGGVTPHNAERVDAIPLPRLTFTQRFLREFRLFWELYPKRVLMNHPDIRAQLHAYDERIVQETAFTTSRMALVSILSVGPMFLFALVGAGAMCVYKDRRAHLSLLCGVILSFAIAYSFYFGKMRYRTPIEPYILILSAYGLWQVGRALARLAPRQDRAGWPPNLTTPSAAGQGNPPPGNVRGQ